MVHKHLPVVLASLFNVDDQNLLEPEAELNEVIELVKCGDTEYREISPEICEIEPVHGIHPDIL